MLSTRLAALAAEAGTDLDIVSIRRRHDEWKKVKPRDAGDINQEQTLREFMALCVWQDVVKCSVGARMRSLLQHGLFEQAASTLHKTFIEIDVPSGTQVNPPLLVVRKAAQYSCSVNY